jgi:hypothetical protein
MLEKINKISVALHKSADNATVSFDKDGSRVQLVVPLSALPSNMQQSGIYARNAGGQWQRIERVDGQQALNMLRALLGEAYVEE